MKVCRTGSACPSARAAAAALAALIAFALQLTLAHNAPADAASKKRAGGNKTNVESEITADGFAESDAPAEKTKKDKKKTAEKKKEKKKKAEKAGSQKAGPELPKFTLDGGLTLEDKKSGNDKKGREGVAGASERKIEKIKELASEIKQSYDEQRKAKPKKNNRYLINIPQSYLDVDREVAARIMERVNLKSLSMFKTLYLPHVRVGKIKKSDQKSKTKDDLDGRTRMCLFIVGNFVNEVIEKYDTGTITKSNKNFQRWLNEGAQLLAFGSSYSMKLPVEEGKSRKKSKEKNGIIPVSTARKLLRALIEVESSATQMKGGKVYTSLNMSTYPRDGSYVIGFMQESVNDFARGVNLFDPEVNIKYTCKKLHKYLVKYNGSTDKMLRAYNAGEGNMDCEQANRYSRKVHGYMGRY